jgi:uncharacterized membrane protein
VSSEPRFVGMPAVRTSLALTDECVFLASESSLYRVLRAHGQTLACMYTLTTRVK